jgi:tetratricopeptide (TPR) repeat protein
MRRLAAIVGCLTALLGGCAGLRNRADLEATAPDASPYCQQLSQAAQAAIDREDWPQACAELERLVAEAPHSAEARHRLARVLLAQGHLVAAEAAERRAIELDPEYVDARIGLGEIETRLGRPQEGLKHVAYAVEIDPRRPEAHIAAGQALEAMGQADEALAAYFRALDLDSSLSLALQRVAAIQLDRNPPQPDQALARLEQVVEVRPNDPEVRFLHGRAALALHHNAQALADLGFAARWLPNRPDVFYYLALALAANRQDAAALKAAERAVQLAPAWSIARDLTRKLRR